MTAQRATVIDSGLNVRFGPGTHYEIVDRLKKGDKVAITERMNHWAKVHPDRGNDGWVYMHGLQFDIPAPAPIEMHEPLPKPVSAGVWWARAGAFVLVILFILWLIGQLT